MEAAPPTYEAATVIDPLSLIGRCLPCADLCSCSLVCKRWHASFTPHLWGNPASHFGIKGEAVYTAVSRFKAILPTARSSVRQLTHTLSLPSFGADFYDGFDEKWLRDVLELLPRLQSLVLKGLPFFDHAALQALVSVSRSGKENRNPRAAERTSLGFNAAFPLQPSSTIPSFGLSLLDASRCTNVTPAALAAALQCFSSLLILDLSFTPAARNVAVLEALGKCTGLQVLGLRAIGLRDDGVDVLCQAIGLRVRSLDIRDNEVTDRGMRALRYYALTHDIDHSREFGSSRPSNSFSHLGTETLDIYQGEGFERYLRNAFTSGFVSRLSIEDAPASGITHLYVSGNSITLECLSTLVWSGTLHVLDAGSVRLESHWSSATARQDETRASGFESMAVSLATHASRSLTYLRIDHSLVTNERQRAMQESRAGSTKDSVSSLQQLHQDEAIQQHPNDFQPPKYEASGAQSDLAFHPAQLPRLKTLVLTGIPSLSLDRRLADRLVAFIRQCALEATLARSQAAVDYDVPPGRRGHSATLKSSADKIFALRRLVLELAPESSLSPDGGSSGKSSRTMQETRFKSMTEDQDSERFWSASENDFSFFSEDATLSHSSRATTGNGRNFSDAHAVETKGDHISISFVASPMVDNIALVSAFRKERKLARQQVLDAGGKEDEVEVDGYWDGVVSVVRNAGRSGD